VAQDRLGHPSIAITLDVYSHVTPMMREDAAATIDVAYAKTKIAREDIV
jgi:integrase